MSLEKFVKTIPVKGRVIVKKENGHIIHDCGNYPFNKYALYGRNEEVLGMFAEADKCVIVIH